MFTNQWALNRSITKADIINGLSFSTTTNTNGTVTLTITQDHPGMAGELTKQIQFKNMEEASDKMRELFSWMSAELKSPPPRCMQSL
jgi:hypothetical protein